MRNKLLSTPRHLWRTSPELGIAIGWTIVCGALWLAVRILGVV